MKEEKENQVSEFEKVIYEVHSDVVDMNILKEYKLLLYRDLDYLLSAHTSDKKACLEEERKFHIELAKKQQDVNNMYKNILNTKLSELEKELEDVSEQVSVFQSKAPSIDEKDLYSISRILHLEDAKRIINKFKENG